MHKDPMKTYLLAVKKNMKKWDEKYNQHYAYPQEIVLYHWLQFQATVTKVVEGVNVKLLLPKYILQLCKMAIAKFQKSWRSSPFYLGFALK